jgi:hypothetical protein
MGLDDPRGVLRQRDRTVVVEIRIGSGHSELLGGQNVVGVFGGLGSGAAVCGHQRR